MFNIAGNNPSGYNLTNSLRFRSSASAYLSRTFGTPTSSTIFTFSAWVKKGKIAAWQGLFTKTGSGDGLWFDDSTGAIRLILSAAASSTAVFRDPSAWYHLVWSKNGTSNTVYINNVSVLTLTGNSSVNSAAAHAIGSYVTNSEYFDGYLAETNFIDGQALTPSSFGSTDATTGSWIPKQYSGTYGTNGFYLPFKDNSALTTASNVGLGRDYSGNSNYWVTNNISITAGTTYDSMTDVPTNTSATVANYPVLNPLDSGAGTYADANLKLTTTTGSYNLAAATMTIPTTGKWYWEATCISSSGTNLNSYMYGIMPSTRKANAGGYVGQNASEWGYYGSNGTLWTSGAGATYGAAYTANDVIGIAFDSTAGTLTFYKNNTSQGVAATGITGEYIPAFCDGSTAGAAVFAVNFGQRPFAYTPPTGFVALNTFNLPTSTIVQGNKYMDATLWTGTSAVRSITNAGAFRPDLVWIKSRSNATDNVLTDSVRGVTLNLISNSSAAQATDANGLTAFNSDGFTIGTNNNYNGSARTFVGWQWQAGSSTVTNTSGSISAQVRANTTTGFSVITYTGNGTAGATVGHGLGVAPRMFIVKNRSNAGNDWSVWHTSISPASNFQVYLSNTTAKLNTWNVWNSTSPSSTTLTLGNDALVNGNTQTYVCYAWAEIAGFSRFGSYTGNGSADGTFVYTGFRPKFVMIKRTDAAGSWFTIDTSRATYNVVNPYLLANAANAEASDLSWDILSNGFKLRSSYADINTNSATMIYMAFAENPFKNANAR